MQDSRLPKFVFALLVAAASIYFALHYSMLAATVASHFDARGVPNGWQSKSVFFGFFVGASVLAAVLGFGIPHVVAAVPIQLINLPNKQYWLAGEQRAASLEFLSAAFAWLGCALYVVIIVSFDYAVQSNIHPSHPPEVSRLWFMIAGFLIFMIFWMVRLFTRFGGIPQDAK